MANRKNPPKMPKDIIDLLAEIPGQRRYSKEERYHDFRQLFTSTEQGKRVYAEILSWCHLFKPELHGSGGIDVHSTFVSIGERNIGLKLLGTVTIEPPAAPQKQSNKQKGESDEN